MKPIFVAEDFEINPLRTDVTLNDQASYQANSIIEKIVSTWPVVTGSYVMGCLSWGTDGCDTDTHTARLAFIQPIEKVECEHEPTGTYDMRGNVCHTILCTKCGAKLKARWELAE